MLSQNDTLGSIHLNKVFSREIKPGALVDDIDDHLGKSSLLVSIKHMVIRFHVTVNQL